MENDRLDCENGKGSLLIKKGGYDTFVYLALTLLFVVGIFGFLGGIIYLLHLLFTQTRELVWAAPVVISAMFLFFAFRRKGGEREWFMERNTVRSLAFHADRLEILPLVREPMAIRLSDVTNVTVEYKQAQLYELKIWDGCAVPLHSLFGPRDVIDVAARRLRRRLLSVKPEAAGSPVEDLATREKQIKNESRMRMAFFALLLLLVAALTIHVEWNEYRIRLLRRDSMHGMGTVTRIGPSGKTKEGASIFYEFKSNTGATHEGKDSFSMRDASRMRVGDDIAIRFFPEDPDINMVAFASGRASQFDRIFVWFLLGIFFSVNVIALRASRKKSRNTLETPSREIRE